MNEEGLLASCLALPVVVESCWSSDAPALFDRSHEPSRTSATSWFVQRGQESMGVGRDGTWARRTINLEEIIVRRLGSKLLGIGNGLLESGRHFDCCWGGWWVWLVCCWYR